MIRTIFTRKNLIAISLSVFYSLIIVFTGICIDGGEASFISKKNPFAMMAASLNFRSVDPGLKQVTDIYHFSFWKKLFRLYVPSVLPYFLAACQSSLGMAWKAGVAAEILAVPEYAIGSEIFFSKQYMYSETLFAWSLIVILLSLVMEKLFLISLKRIGRKFHLVPKGGSHAEI